MEYKISTRNHWWFDSGLVGLYSIASYLMKDSEVKVRAVEDGVIFKYENEDVLRKFLRSCYEEMANRYYNISNLKQLEACELIAYNEVKDELYSIPKRQPIPPVAKLLSANSWSKIGIEYKELDENLKIRVDEYKKEKKKNLFGKKEILLTEPQTCHDKKLEILPDEKGKKLNKTCTLCGKSVSKVKDVTQLVYMLVASKQAARSFHSEAKGVDKVCWECSFIARFVYEALYFKKNKDDLLLIVPYDTNFERLVDMQDKMGIKSSLRELNKEYFFSNIKGELLKKSNSSSEILWSMYVDKYRMLKDDVDEIQFKKDVMDLIMSPIQIVVLSLKDKGQTISPKSLLIYQDSSYMFRILDKLSNEEIDFDKIFNDLYEKDQTKAETLMRNRILERFLKKQSFLLELETVCFRKVMNSSSYIGMKNMLDFVMNYELLVREDTMKKEQIEVAVKLGKQIVLQAFDHGKKNGNDISKKIKGDLFTLRKTRTVIDFLNQLNTLQFRYGISVNTAILEGMVDEVEFEKFKAYCILGALNVYNMKSRKGDKENEK